MVIIHIARVWWWPWGSTLVKSGSHVHYKTMYLHQFLFEKNQHYKYIASTMVAKNILGRGGSSRDRPSIFLDFLDKVTKLFCCWLDGVCMHFPLLYTSLVSIMWSNSTRHDPKNHVSTDFLVQTKTYLHMR